MIGMNYAMQHFKESKMNHVWQYLKSCNWITQREWLVYSGQMNHTRLTDSLLNKWIIEWNMYRRTQWIKHDEWDLQESNELNGIWLKVRPVNGLNIAKTNCWYGYLQKKQMIQTK